MRRFVGYKKLDAEDTARRFVVYHEKAGARLPSQYQEVEYIQSDGTQWVDTEFQYTKTTGEIKAKFVPLELGTNYYTYRLAGAYNGTNRSFMMYNATNPAQIGLGGSDYSTTIPEVVNTEYIIDALIETANTCIYTLNGTTTNISYTGSLATSKNYYLFGDNENGVANFLGKYKLYYYQMYEDNILVRHFIPCYDTENSNKPGLYELVEGKFYINKGTGTDFTLGPITTATVPARFVIYWSEEEN